MKAKLLVLAIFYTAMYFSQNYRPLLQDGNKWYERNEEYNFDLPSPNYYYYRFINGEEVKNGITYKKIYSNLYCYTRDRYLPCTPQTNPDVFYNLLREDIAQKKVYYFDEDTNSEILLYDFSINVGDNYPNNFPFTGANSVPKLSIESIGYGDVFDRNVRIFRIEDYVGIYEGIGSSSGLLFKPGRPIFEGGNFLECFEDAFSPKSCNWVMATKETGISNALKIIYLADRGVFKIHGNSSKTYNVSFYDASGRLLDSVRIESNKEFQIKNLTKGILYYSIQSDQEVWRDKIMIH